MSPSKETTPPPQHISLSDPPPTDSADHDTPKTPRSSSGWDGKLRLEKQVELANPEAISDAEYSDEENVLPGEEIEADEDLLDDYPSTTTEIDCVHARISSIPSLRLSRFPEVQRLCLRQNSISSISGLEPLSETLTELDLYDNLLTRIAHLEDLPNLKSLDLSFNKIKHIKNISHLTKLTDLYFVQNKISTIENLEGLTKLRNLELAANRIREIQGLETLVGLEELWLGKNKITTITGLDTLQNLRILSIQSNRIREISGLSSLPHLEELYISHNALTTLNGLESCTGLRVLDISNNQISSLKGLENMPDLEEVWASYNQIGDFKEVEEELGRKEQLNTVYFEGNPLQLRQPALYRNKVRLALPRIKQIDATFIRVS
ncbi:probable regulatory subunit of protein phosphatase-1 [Rhynchosporium graminicola]|uniref:Probable regulatory subunit of protein phosphatase-1 n=1 Tax=Rhynchosporium graminicola TaxID=2792576 RepID=A0A1E1L0I2_9HELO|nr:probable regulatory subunit of protein phosphatase-1 [Rhynchosporium commune]